MICPKCGGFVPEDQYFCSSCGYRIRPNPKKHKDDDKGVTKPPKRPFKWQYLVIALLVLGVGFLIYRLVLGNKLSPSALNDEIVNINILYDEVQAELNAGELQKVEEDGVIYHYDDLGALRFVYVKPGTGGLDYERTFYYHNDKLFFAYYEENDSHSLYFKDDELIRWRYCADKSNPSAREDFDQQHREQSYQDMESTVLTEAYSYLNH